MIKWKLLKFKKKAPKFGAFFMTSQWYYKIVLI